MTEQTRPTPHSDAPTTDDELARRPFAQLLAREIEVVPAGQGLVIGLVGPWGSGKTSVLKMMSEELSVEAPEEGANPQVVVIEFNPWFFSGAAELLSGFFGTLMTALPEHLGESTAARVGQRLKSYGELLGKLRDIPVIGDFAGAGADTAVAAGGLIDDRPGTLQEHRDRLAEALAELDVRIVVVVDDVDRLQPAETLELMRMVKLVGDLPNVIYLMSFDREHVAEALSAQHPGVSGSEYLEKIIQIEHYLPEAPPDRLQLMLENAVNRAIEAVPQERLDVQRWAEVHRRILLPLVRGPRQVRRYANAIPLALDLAGEEVDPVDVLTLTAIRVFLPEFHRQLPSLVDELTPGIREAMMWQRDEARTEAADRLEQVAAIGDFPEVVRALYDLLFPASAAASSGAAGSDNTEWSRRRRVADRDALTRYLTAALPEGAISVSEIQRSIRAFKETADLRCVLEGRDAAGVNELLGRLYAHLDEIAPSDAENALPVLLRQYPRLAIEDRGLWSPAARLVSFVAALTLRIDDLDKRETTLRLCFDEAETLSSRFRVFYVASRLDEQERTIVREVPLQALADDLAEEVLAAEAEALIQELDLPRLLSLTRACVLPDGLARFRERLTDDQIFVKYVALFMELGRGERDYDLRWDAIVKDLGEDWLVSRLESVGEPVLSDHERDALSQAREAANALESSP